MNYLEIAEEIRLCENGGDNEELARRLEQLAGQGQKTAWTAEELELLREGVSLKICLVETGSPILRARDVVAMGEREARRSGGKLKALGSDQMRLILQLEDLRKKLGGP